MEGSLSSGSPARIPSVGTTGYPGTQPQRPPSTQSVPSSGPQCMPLDAAMALGMNACMSNGEDGTAVPDRPWPFPTINDRDGAVATAMMERVRAAARVAGTQLPGGSMTPLFGQPCRGSAACRTTDDAAAISVICAAAAAAILTTTFPPFSAYVLESGALVLGIS